LCSKDGCPVAVEVYKGNTKDDTTVLDKIDEIKSKFGINEVIFVGDRGMVTKARYDKIDHETVKVISALTHGDIKELCEREVVQLSLFDEKSIVEVIDGNMRYCLCKNPLMQEKETKTRRALLDKTAEELNKIVSSTRKCKNSKEIRAGKVVNKYEMAKFVKFHGAGNDLKWEFDQDKLDREQLLDGCYVIYTDVSEDDMTAAETVSNYKNLIKVEQAFKNLKTTRLEIRPIYHKTDDRIRCHVFLCMLAYYIMWHMKQRLKPLFDKDGSGKDRKYTFKYVMESLKAIRSELVSVGPQTTNIITSPTEVQQEILSLLNIAV
jgi:transposase